MTILRRLFWTAFLTLLLPLAFAGCGGGGPDENFGGNDEDDETAVAPADDDDEETVAGDNAAFVGTWALRQGSGGVEWYILFKADNSWLISDTADGSARRVFGTYAVDGNRAAGPMVNPGTGEGEIIATLQGANLSLDFVEFWHDPHKHVLYNGTKM